MKKSTLFLIFSIFFLAVGAYFGFTYLNSEMEAKNVSQLLLTVSNLLLAVAMFVLSRNKAFRQEQ